MTLRKSISTPFSLGLLLALVSFGLLVQCQVQNTCTTGNTSICICPDQQQGTRTCREDGIFGPCLCPLPRTEQTPAEQTDPQEQVATCDSGACGAEGAAEPVAEPVSEPAAEPTSEPSAEPASEPTSSETTAEASEPTADGGGQEADPAESVGDIDCNEVCQGGTVCVGGVCKCPAGQTLCDGRCADLQSDVEHCGSCGNACGGTTSACLQGKCQCFFSNNKYTLTGNLGGGVGAMSFSADGKSLVVATNQRQITVFQAGNAYPLSFQFPDKVGMDNASGISFGKNPDLFLLTGGSVYPYTFSMSKKAREGSPIYTRPHGISGARSTKDDKWAVLNRMDATTTPPKEPQIWAQNEPGASKGQKIITMTGITVQPTRMLYHPDGERLFISFADGQVLVWKNSDWKQHQQLKQDSRILRSLTLSKDGTLLAAGTDDNSIHLWDATTYQYLRTMSYSATFSFDVNSVNFSPDNKWLVSAHDDGTVRIWDVSSGKQVHLLAGHRLAVSSALFSPDGKDILSGGNEAKVLVWTCR